MLIVPNHSLKTHNTLGIDVRCSRYCAPCSDADMLEALHAGIFDAPFLALGGGSNVLFTGNYAGCVVHPAMSYLVVKSQNEHAVMLEAGAGTTWDDMVKYCVEHGWYGVENLSHIPGSVGAAPVQNIGAYGMEAAQSIHSVRYFDTQEHVFRSISHDDCRFEYRGSIFKHELSGRAVVVSVVFMLKKHGRLQTAYGALRSELERHGGASLQGMRRAVIAIRSSKLPDPAVLGNAGSFFKNPVVSTEMAQHLKQQYPDIPLYDGAGAGMVKVSAAWLIERCGWRGMRCGDAGVHTEQALVLVNHGSATGSEILALSNAIAQDIRQQYGIALESEVMVINN